MLTKAWNLFTADQRHYQIAVIGSLLIYGLASGRLDTPWYHIVATIVTAQVVQWIAMKALGITFDFRSAFTSSISLSFLLHTDLVIISIFAAAIAIGSKFTLRSGKKHIFNPAAFGIVAAVVLGQGEAWVDIAQWGEAVWLAAVITLAGLFVTRSVGRYDVTFVFLGAYFAFLLTFAGITHTSIVATLVAQQNVALLLFSFFMITDPMTIPDTIRGRIFFAVLTALVGSIFYFLAVPGGLFAAIVLTNMCVPLIDSSAPGTRFVWGRRTV